MRNEIIPSLLSLLVGVAAAQQAPTAVTYVQTQSTGIISLATSQLARLNLLNVTAPPPAGVTSAGCTVQVQFIDDQGTVQKSTTVTVDAGKSMKVEYTYAGSAGSEAIRAVVGVEHQLPPPVMGTTSSIVTLPFYFCSLVPTLEIIDTGSQKTSFVVSDFHYVSYALPVGIGLGAPTVR